MDSGNDLDYDEPCPGCSRDVPFDVAHTCSPREPLSIGLEESLQRLHDAQNPDVSPPPVAGAGWLTMTPEEVRWANAQPRGHGKRWRTEAVAQRAENARLTAVLGEAEARIDQFARLANTASAEREAALQRVRVLEGERDNLRLLVEDAIRSICWDANLDGADIEMLALNLGILVPTKVMGPCAPEGGCNCATYDGDWPMECNRFAWKATPTEQVDTDREQNDG